MDTKWKKLAEPTDRKHGVSQADVYQLMGYARLYECSELMLLYPEVPGRKCGERRVFGIAKGRERLKVASVDVSQPQDVTATRLRSLFQETCLIASEADCAA